MKLTRKVLASIVTLLVACLVHAADINPVARVIAITDVETNDPTGYAAWLSQANDIIKAKLGIDTYYKVYVSNIDGVKSGSVRNVVSADSVTAMAKNTDAIASDPALKEIAAHYGAIRKIGSRVLYQCLRFDGTYKGSYVHTTLMNVSDEAGYLKTFDSLRALYDAKGFKDAKINVYRVMVGRTNFTHRVTISLPSNERLVAMLDALAFDAQYMAWLADLAKYRTVVSNTTAHDIMK
jgi:hypothetical protein